MSTELTTDEAAFMARIAQDATLGVRVLPTRDYTRVRELFTRWPTTLEDGTRANAHCVYTDPTDPHEHLFIKGHKVYVTP